MSFIKHCSLCDNVKTNLQDGITCSLTEKRPAFNKTCPKIKLEEKFKNQLGLIIIDIEKLKKKKNTTFISFFLYLIIGCIIIISQNNLFIDFKFSYTYYKRSTGSILLIFIGFGLICLAFNKLNTYIKKRKNLKEKKKKKIDTILNKYEIEYSYKVEFCEKNHGSQKVVVELKSNSNLLKNSKSTFKI